MVSTLGGHLVTAGYYLGNVGIKVKRALLKAYCL